MMRAFIKTIILFPLRLYSNYLSYYLPASCRFYPSCSQYSIEAIETHGIFKGIYLSIARLLRCHPWHKGGADPVPNKKTGEFGECCIHHPKPQPTPEMSIDKL